MAVNSALSLVRQSLISQIRPILSWRFRLQLKVYIPSNAGQLVHLIGQSPVARVLTLYLCQFQQTNEVLFAQYWLLQYR